MFVNGTHIDIDLNNLSILLCVHILPILRSLRAEVTDLRDFVSRTASSYHYSFERIGILSYSNKMKFPLRHTQPALNHLDQQRDHGVLSIFYVSHSPLRSNLQSNPTREIRVYFFRFIIPSHRESNSIILFLTSFDPYKNARYDQEAILKIRKNQLCVKFPWIFLEAFRTRWTTDGLGPDGCSNCTYFERASKPPRQRIPNEFAYHKPTQEDR